MATSLWRLRRLTAEAYLYGLAAYDRLAIRSRSGPRDFSRVYVVAATQKQNGIAVGARLQVEALRRLGVEATLLDATPALRDPRYRVPHAPGSAYIFHSGGPQLASMLASVLPHAARAWRVAYWAWELPSPPKRWPDPRGLVSEIWTPSQYARQSLMREFKVPILVAPHAVLPAKAPRVRPPDQPFTVLTFADSRSSFERKNPAGAIRAFIRAFGDRPDRRLIVKLNGAADGVDLLPPEVRTFSNITLINQFMDDAALISLFRSADVFLSLHRAEGFGIPMLEAMAQGVPVVGTGWSGNLEFMTPDNSVLIPSQETAVQDSAVYFRYGAAVWAEPDEPAAAQALERLASDPAELAALSARAAEAAAHFAASWRIPD